MAETLLSVGIDVGTTTTQLVVSRLTAQNRASAFAVPRLEITDREILYESPIHFTPLIRGELVDADAIRALVEQEYARAGIRREAVDTGAIIITGETSRKENAEAALHALSGFAGDFVVATAGPDLESVLAAKGAGAVEFSVASGKTVLHMDIGGGTSNLALVEEGRIRAVTCLNVGGRLVRLDREGRISYVSPVLEGLVNWSVGEPLTRQQAWETARLLVRILEVAAGLRPRDGLFARFVTKEASAQWDPPAGAVLSFSGGVADCIESERDWLAYGDLGPLLGQAIRQSALCAGPYRLGEQTIRATVIGAGCHSAQLSGSTVYCANVRLPLKNLPTARLSEGEQELAARELQLLIRQRLQGLEGEGVLALPGWMAPRYGQITALADAIAGAAGDRAVYVAVEADMAKALGHALALRLPPGTPCLCLDSIALTADSYLDVGRTLSTAYPVVVKTLILNK